VPDDSSLTHLLTIGNENFLSVRPETNDAIIKRWVKPGAVLTTLAHLRASAPIPFLSALNSFANPNARDWPAKKEFNAVTLLGLSTTMGENGGAAGRD
jgi:hypothetical protein